MMKTEYREEAKHTVAIVFGNDKPAFLHSSYGNEEWWIKLIQCVHLSPYMKHARCVMDNTAEGQAILRGTPSQSLTPEFLLGLDPAQMHNMARAYGLDPKEYSEYGPKVLCLAIMTAVAKGIQPKTVDEELVVVR